MGFNTVAVLYNDMTHEIRKSGPVGFRIASAMTNWSDRDRHPLATDFHCGKVVSQAHADYSQVVVVGQNTGAPLSECNALDWYALNQLAEALKRHGWTVKEPTKKRETPSAAER